VDTIVSRGVLTLGSNLSMDGYDLLFNFVFQVILEKDGSFYRDFHPVRGTVLMQKKRAD